MRPAATRVRAALGPITLTALAAALAWLVAHRVLGHAEPFFAPIAAVPLGILLAEGLTSVIGISTVALGVIVFVNPRVLGGCRRRLLRRRVTSSPPSRGSKGPRGSAS